MRFRRKARQQPEAPPAKPGKRTSQTLADASLLDLLDPMALVFLPATAFLLWRTVGPGKRKLQRDRQEQAERKAARNARIRSFLGLRKTTDT